jgi:hypothetical protein
MSLLGCTAEKDSKKPWTLMTIGMEFYASSTVTNFVDGTVYTKVWNGDVVKVNDYGWTREHPSAYQIKHDAPSDYNKFWVTNRGCCCYQCRFNLYIKNQSAGARTTTLRNDHRTVEFEVSWETFTDGVSSGTGNERIRPIFRPNSSPSEFSQFCKNSSEPGRSPQEFIASWENDNMTAWIFGGGGTQITKTRTYTGSDGKTTSGGWAGTNFSLTEGEYAGYNNALAMYGVCETDQIYMTAKLEWELNYQHTGAYDYDSVFSGYMTTSIQIET